MEKLYRLPKEFATKWLAALRSGEYKQGHSFLYIKSIGCHCSLGVAGAVLGNSNDDMEGITSLNWDFLNAPPDEIRTVNRHTLGGKIATINDQGEMSFPEIADWIESNCSLY